MIIQEMTGELHALELYAKEVARLHELEQRRDALHDALRDRQNALKEVQKHLDARDDAAEAPPEVPVANESEAAAQARVEAEAVKLRLRRSIDRVRVQLKAVDDEYDGLDRMIERATHPFWGSPFKAEGELSSFGEQVERFACLYTDRVTNLLHYSASHYFRGPRHRMAHE
jgi:hypothetical protein